jgi:hypothetical protein
MKNTQPFRFNNEFKTFLFAKLADEARKRGYNKDKKYFTKETTDYIKAGMMWWYG